MANLERFLSNFNKHNDFSKTSKFEVSILGSPVVGPAQDLTLQCEVAELPGYNINTVDGLVYGAPYAVAATPVLNELNLTFICAGDLWEKKYFDTWLQYILPQRSYLAKYRDEYASTVTVTQFTEQGTAAHKVEFVEAFPFTVSPIALNWGDDGINRLSVGFKYRSWKSVPVQGFLNTPFAPPLLATSSEPALSVRNTLLGALSAVNDTTTAPTTGGFFTITP